MRLYELSGEAHANFSSEDVRVILANAGKAYDHEMIEVMREHYHGKGVQVGEIAYGNKTNMFFKVSTDEVITSRLARKYLNNRAYTVGVYVRRIYYVNVVAKHDTDLKTGLKEKLRVPFREHDQSVHHIHPHENGRFLYKMHSSPTKLKGGDKPIKMVIEVSTSVNFDIDYALKHFLQGAPT